MKISIQPRATTSSLIALVLLCFIAVVASSRRHELAAGYQTARHTQDILIQLATLQSTITDAETGVRGFALTGDEQFLEPYNAAVGKVDTEIHLLRSSLDDHAQQQRFENLVPLIVQRMALAKGMVDIRRTAGSAGAEHEIATLSGKKVQDRIRAAIADLVGHQKELLAQAEERDSIRAGRLGTIVVLASVLCLVCTGSAVRTAIREVTARQRLAELGRAEEEIRKSEQRYHTLFDSMDEGFCTVEVLFDESNEAVDFRFLDVNPVFEKLTGIENARGRRMRKIAPQHEEYWFATLGKIALTGEPARYENWAEQLHRWYEMHAFRIGEPQERKVAIFFNDITERKRSEEALRRSEDRFSKAFRSNPLAITISTEAEGRYFDVNDAFLNLLGYERREVIGRTAADLRFWSEPSDRAEMIRQLQEEHRVAKHQTRLRTVKGEIREAEVWAESIELDGERCVLGITRDITEIRELEAQFRQAQKMEAVGRLAGGVAHDFNNILGVIMGYSDLALGEVPPDHFVTKYFVEIKKAAHRAALLTRQLLAFSRQQVAFPRILDLNNVVRDVTTMILRLVGEDVEVEFRPGTAIGTIKADPGQIEQILMNLVVNARDAMPTGGKIIIETGQAELDEHYAAEHAGARVGNHVVLKVSDTGCGMDEATKSRIFEPFFTTKAVGRGTGLGLSTVYGIVKQSEGYIAVYSEPGRGTTFKIYFPRLHEKAAELDTHREDEMPPRGSETILVVEDDASMRALAVQLLQDSGYQVIEADNAEHALRILAASHSQIDLLATDVIMPGISGIELARRAEEVHPKLRSLFISGYTGDLMSKQRMAIDEASFLEKPFTKRSLLKKVYSILHRERPEARDR